MKTQSAIIIVPITDLPSLDNLHTFGKMTHVCEAMGWNIKDFRKAKKNSNKILENPDGRERSDTDHEGETFTYRESNGQRIYWEFQGYTVIESYIREA